MTRQPTGKRCQLNNLLLNVNKTKELIVDFRKEQREHTLIHIDGTASREGGKEAEEIWLVT